MGSTPPRYLVDLAQARRPRHIGAKARNLAFLFDQDLAVPQTYVCTWVAYERYVADQVGLIDGLKDELSQLDPTCAYAVRSSANLEDSAVFSFAGQFKSALGVRSADGILNAIWGVWSSVGSHEVQAYLQRNEIDPAALRMAVIVQQMVPAQVSGVAFSKNPVTGMDEVVVEAVEGSGEALVQQGVTPERWVNKWGAWIDQPAESAVPLELIQQVVECTRSIARAYGHAVDLEWVYDGATLYWVQLREITTLDVPVYANHISKEVFPGIIKPLVWSVNVPLVNGAWVRLFTELIGPNDIEAESLAKSFYYRAYFNMGAIGAIFERLGFPREALELLMGIELGGEEKPSLKPTPKTLAFLPRVLRFVLGKLSFGRRVRAFLPAAREQYAAFHAAPVEQMGEQALLEQIDRLFDLTQQAAYYNILTPLLMQVYSRMLRGQLARVGFDLDEIDLTAGLPELEQYQPNPHLARLHRHYLGLDPALRARVAEADYAAFCAMPEAGDLRREVERFLDRFGHLSDSGNDFSSLPWRQNPDLVLYMVVHWASGDDSTERGTRLQDFGLPRLQRALLAPLWARAQRFMVHREAISSLYTYGYGLFRRYYLALGERLARRGLLAAADEILYLRVQEVQALVRDDKEAARCAALIADRQSEMGACQDMVPPSVIYGDEPLPARSAIQGHLYGTPTSHGQYTGPARIVRGLSDFYRLEQGDVLVVPFTDVGWTPLFAQAGAIIAESGGILSHSSIIAREYGIPAVVSVAGACLLPDGVPVTVDGFRGQVVVHEWQAP